MMMTDRLSSGAGYAATREDAMAALAKTWRRTDEKAQPLINIPHGPPSCLEDACGVIFDRESAGEPASADGKPHSTSGSIQGFGYLLTALRRQRLASDKLVLQLATLLRSHDLFLELSVGTPWTPRTLTANQVRHSGKQSTDGR
jgi:hypothetical protein